MKRVGRCDYDVFFFWGVFSVIFICISNASLQ